MKITYAIEIKSTPEAVFRWLEQPEKAKAWMTSVSKTEILQETSERIGTTFRETVEGDDGAVEMQGVITSFVPNRLIGFHLSSKVNVVDVDYGLEETPYGARLAVNANVQWKFPVNVISVVMGDKIRQNILAQFQGECGKLKELCESQGEVSCLLKPKGVTP